MILADDERYRIDRADALVWLRGLPDRSVNLVFFSPPYEAQRTYGVGFKRKRQQWVDWLRPIVVECSRVSTGLVCVNMSAPVVGGAYTASVEWLVADLTRLDGVVCGPSPHAWVKSEDYDDAPGNGVPGSGGPRYQRRDWEPVYSFCLPDRLPLTGTDNTAFGRPPRYQPGGVMSNRDKSGERANANGDGRRVFGNPPGHSRRVNGKMKSVKRENFGHAANGTIKGNHARECVTGDSPIANPGNVLASDVMRVPVGGGKLGCPVAHEGEAPMALNLAERFVCWYCPPGGICCDPFAGTGTTGHAALKYGRRFIGCDVRESQVELANKRLGMVPMELFT
jgi:hypothetical protein